VLNEAYNSNIKIENPAIRDIKITTTFKEESLDKIVSVISSTIDIKVERRGNEIILK
jgi:ferric-dicitrate binding protein FerR (iron transport regulator)